MNRIDELISELAPQGAQYRRVGDVFETVATPRGIKRSDYSLGKTIPIVDQGQSLIAGYTDNGSLKIGEGPYVVFGDHTRAVKWIDFPFAVGADGTKVLKAKSGILSKYMYYTMANLDITDRGYNRHWTIVRDMRIPVPPLEVQREIVRILDKFTQLEARRAQYEHYRHEALTFAADVNTVALGEIVKIKTGAPVSKEKIANSPGEYPVINSGREPLGYINEFNTEGDPLGVTSRGAGVGSITWADGRYYRGNLNYAVSIRDSAVVDVRFLFHTLLHLQPQIRALCTYQGIPALNKSNLQRLMVPLPSREEQKRVVEVLDRFDALVSDISIGLPAELAARRKQYEHYRDRLLTFKELAS